MIISSTRGSSIDLPSVLPRMVLSPMRAFITHSLFFGLILMEIGAGAPLAHAQKVEMSFDASTAGAKIDRNIFGQFAEHLGHGIYEGMWVGPGIKLPSVDAIAAKDKAGKLWLALTNLDPNQPAEIEVSLTGLNAKSAAGETLTAPKVDSVNTFEAPSTVVPKPYSAKIAGGKVSVKLEPKSVTVISLEQ